MKRKIVVGQVARGINFFPRIKIINHLWNRIENGSNILIAAPRRVGKTSIMMYIQDNPKDNYHVVYLLTESVNSEKEYYKRLWKEIVENDFNKNIHKFSNKAQVFIKSVMSKISELGVPDIASVKINNEDILDYRNEFVRLLESIDLGSQKILIMIDEFPQTLENIINYEGKEAAIHFLQTNRELRQNPEINQKIQFIYTGSIGLESVVSGVGSINLINDLESFKVIPLNESEGKQLIAELVENLKFDLTDQLSQLIIEKIKWLIPYYIQLVIQEINTIIYETEELIVNESTINKAFDNLLDNRNYFEHWYERLKKDKFSKKILNYISLNNTISSPEILNIAVGLNIEEDYRPILRALEHDGYINRDNINNYRFNSPILQMWWVRNVAG